MSGTIFKGAEADWRQWLPGGQWAVIRIDGRAFHTFCRPLARPYDTGMIAAMDATAQAVADEVGQQAFAYTQSDEISIVSPPVPERSQRLFGGRTDKLTSVLAATASVVFNDHVDHPSGARGTFDARVFALDGRDLVDEYLRWRVADARRNAISMVAEHHLTRSQLHGVPTSRRLELLSDLGVHMGEVEPGFRHGRWLRRRPVVADVTYVRDGVEQVAEGVVRHVWDVQVADTDPSTWETAPSLADVA